MYTCMCITNVKKFFQVSVSVGVQGRHLPCQPLKISYLSYYVPHAVWDLYDFYSIEAATAANAESKMCCQIFVPELEPSLGPT